MSHIALAPGRAREYETIYILRPVVDKETAGALTSRLADAVKAEQGRLTQVELWGRRRLAYEIHGHRRGVYVYLKYLGRGNVVLELERQLRLADSVIRYQTIMVRSDVVVEGVDIPEASAQLDFDLPTDQEDVELTRERELGLDMLPSERAGRGRRDDRERGRGGEEGEDGIFDEEDEAGPGWDDEEGGGKPPVAEG